jgi:hypothetical protein
MTARTLLGLALAAGAGALLVVAAGACSSGSSSGGAAGAVDCPTLDFPTTCPTPPPSWKTDVQPLFQSYCEECHGNGGQAALQVPLATYQDVVNNRTRCWEQIYTCSMPNTDASPPATAFPTAEQRQMMVTWLDVCNAPDN